MTRSAASSLEALARAVRAHADVPVPVLVARLPDLERVAWRRGLRAARALERRAAGAFERAAGVVLRAGDLLAHDTGTDAFVAALLPGGRGDAVTAPVDARAALARIAAALESSTGLTVLTGWTTVERGDTADAASLVDRALRRGAQERERYGFFSALGHELRTPLSSIRGYLETLLDERVDEATRRRFLRVAHDESLRMSRLIEGMFEISLLDLQAAFSPRTSCSVAEAIAVAVDACARTAAARGVAVETACAPGLRAAIDGDRLTLVLVNLLDNALKHGSTGGRVQVSAADDAAGVTVAVDDDGPGIGPAQIERIFAFGERGATSAEGTGIGLALVRLIVERAGGRVDATASPLGGARFTVRVAR